MMTADSTGIMVMALQYLIKTLGTLVAYGQ